MSEHPHGLIPLSLDQTLFLLEPGPVVLVATQTAGVPNLMTISWIMPIDFTHGFALATGPWNYSFAALLREKECVVAIPGADLAETVVRIGDCSGREVDKFARFGLTPLQAKRVKAPLVAECLACLECRVTEYIERHSLVILRAVAAWGNPARTERRVFHARGDGTFTLDGARFSHQELMRDKLPPSADDVYL